MVIKLRVQLIRYHDLDNMNTRLASSLNRKQGVLPPLGLAYIASALEKAGHQVDLIDAIALCLSKAQVEQRIIEFNPTVVGITAMTPTVRGALEAANLAKKHGAITVIGGVHMSILAKDTLSYDFVDFGIVGEGEESFVEFCDALEQDKILDGIVGLCYKTDGNIHVGLPRIVDDVDTLAMPAYHLLPMTKYSSIIGLHPTSTMMGSRGCPYQCGFCFKTPSDKKYRTRDVESIVDEIKYLVDTYHVKEVMFYDDIMPKDYARALSLEIIKRNIKIKWQTPERVNLVEPELLKLMAKSGCHIIRFGVEQGDPEMMALVEKKINPEQVKSAFKAAKLAGINTFAYFIIGYIYENERTMQATIDLAKELNPRYVMFTKAVPLPATPLMQQSIKEGFVQADYWNRFTLGEDLDPIPPLVPNADKWVSQAYRSFYLRPRKIFEQLRNIRSLKDVQKNLDGLLAILKFQMRDDAFTVLKQSVTKKPSEITESKLNNIHPTAYTGGTGIDHPSFKTSGDSLIPLRVDESQSVRVEGKVGQQNHSTKVH